MKALNSNRWLGVALGTTALVLVSACAESPLTLALEEPIGVADAQFLAGDLPGSAPKEGAPPKKPYATSIITYRSSIRQGVAGVEYSGIVSDEAVSVGVRLKEAGSGYFVFPAGFPEAANPGFLGTNFSVSFHEHIEPGPYTLQVAAIDENGKSGTISETEICVGSAIIDNGNSCDPTKAPPAVVLSLAWDSAVDLDLRVVTPSGVVVSSKDPSTGVPGEDGKVDLTDPALGTIDLDSNRNCVIDGVQRENLVFQGRPESGTYRVYANLFDACGEHSVGYKLSLLTRTPGEAADTFAVQTTEKSAGTLIRDQVKPIESSGTFIGEFSVK